MKCSACGYALPEGAEFCKRCGTKAVTGKKSDKPPSRAGTARKAPKVKYRVSKLKIVLTILILASMAVLGYYAVKVNRNIVGHWRYVGSTDFFTGEKIEVNKENKKGNASDTLTVRNVVEIIIKDKTLELKENNRTIGMTEYVMEEDTIVGADAVTRLKVKWDGLSPVLEGRLFEREGTVKDLDRVETSEQTIENMVFIIIFSALGIALVFVASIKGKPYTQKMEIAHSAMGSSSARTALARRVTVKERGGPYMGGARDDSMRGMVSRMSTPGDLTGERPTYVEADASAFRKSAYATRAVKSVGLRSTLHTKSPADLADSAFSVPASSSERFSFGGRLDGSFETPSKMAGSGLESRKETDLYKTDSSGKPGATTKSRLVGSLKTPSSEIESASVTTSLVKKESASGHIEVPSEAVTATSSDKGGGDWFGSAGDL